MTLGNLPFIWQVIGEIERDIKVFGFQETLMKAVLRSGTKLKIFGKTKYVENILENNPAIVVSNHPHAIETVVLPAILPPRSDCYLIINERFTHIIPKLKKYLIPVYIQHNISPDLKKKLLTKIFKKIFPQLYLKPEEEHKKNVQSVSMAAKKVRNGGLVVIFPNPGGVRTDGRWFLGIGHLIKEAGRKLPFFIVNVYIRGTSPLDYFRIIPGMGRFLPSVTLSFSPPMKSTKIIKKNAKEIALNLEKEYNKWVKTLS